MASILFDCIFRCCSSDPAETSPDKVPFTIIDPAAETSPDKVPFTIIDPAEISFTLTDSIHFALHQLHLLLDTKPSDREYLLLLELLRFRLRNLKAFVLYARILSNDASLGSFLAEIDDAVRRNAERINVVLPLWGYADMFQRSIASFDKGIDDWSVALLDTARQSSCLTTYEVLEIIGSFMENQAEFRSSMIEHCVEDVVYELELLEEQLTFLQTLILFITQRNTEQREDLLAHAGTVAINAGYLLLKNGVHKYNEILHRRFYYGIDFQESEQWKISTLLQQIKPIDPRVCKTYTDALTTSKLARKSLTLNDDQDMEDEALTTTKNLLNFLISFLWEVLPRNTSALVPMKDQQLELYEGLRSLRKMIHKQQENKFVLKTKEDIVAVVCDAGVFIFSLYQTNVQLDLGPLPKLLEAIKIILADLGEKDVPVPEFNYSPSTTQLAFVDSLLQKMEELISSNNAEPTAKTHVKTIQEELVFLRSFLGVILDLQHDQPELKTLGVRVLEVAYRVEDSIDSLMVGNIPDSLSTSFDSIMEEIINIKSEAKAKTPEFKSKRKEIKVKKVIRTHSHVQPKIASMTKDVVGFHDEAKSIANRVLRGLKKLQVVTIVGMPGLGKTTLAEKVYNDPSMLHRFSARAFTTVSQAVDKKRVLIDILKQVAPERYSHVSSESTAADVADQVRRSLKGRPYLVVLDDLWEAEAWECLQESFPDDSLGSRIIVTSRCHDVAPLDMLDGKPFELGQLTEEESLDLLQRNLHGGDFRPNELGDLAIQFAEICNGVPLTILIVAGILKSTSPEDWEQILASLSRGNLLDRCKDTLELSYSHLPERLKRCFLYLAAFQEDEKVSATKLLHLWMAEGFIQKVEMKRLSDVAEEYLNDLIGRSLLMVAERKFDGRVKTCRVHDLLHELCSQKAKDDQFFYFLEGGYEELSAFNEPRYLRRLCIHSSAKHFVESKISCSRVRSLRFKHYEESRTRNFSFMHMCRLLRVLDLEQVCLAGEIPNEIGLLVWLAYLAIRYQYEGIPPSVGNLSNLETFIVHKEFESVISLADSFWNLRKLKHFYVRRASAVLPLENLDNSPDLYELDKICGLMLPLDCNMERVMRKFPNIRKLRCELCGFHNHGGNLVQVVIPDFLSQLVSLYLLVDKDEIPEHMRFDISLPANLKKLTLWGFHLSERSPSSIGRLPNLEILELISVEFEGNTWRMEEEEFSKLRYLKLDFSSLRTWSGSDDQFGCLEKLKLSYCLDLEEIPSCLESITMLQMIKVKSCHKAVEESVEKIEEVQAEYGNSDLNVFIR
ncbi:OLC1v1031773C1 [Oldenlandia corymbosa var. corymbosa]|uniref:OLC1v1031773C1 n=1 Tax=Oldenlandia corymbosa var. corymbosa TaxID=529605 RepID=A0AAV1CK16_OLDCO|nr:OLC1v1031773C1 [Oldenlandia corymbosa var. corymbosa]